MTEADITILEKNMTRSSELCIIMLVEDDKSRGVLRDMITIADKIAASEMRDKWLWALRLRAAPLYNED
jgi:hypothetical protein